MPNFTNRQANEIYALLEKNDLKTASSVLYSVNFSSRNALWYYMSGNYYYKKGWLESAYEDYKKAYELNPNEPTFKEAYARIEAQRQGNEKAFKNSEPKDHKVLNFCCDYTELFDCCP